MKAVVLGCGYHGRGIAYEIAAADDVETVLAVDADAERARKVAGRTGGTWAAFDVHDRARLAEALDGAALVFNAVGPYHYRRNALGVIEAAIAAGVAYADMCDDHEVAETLFGDAAWDARARDAGVGVLVGTGIAPGISALLARLGCERLERAERVAIRFAWNYLVDDPAAIHHFLRVNAGAGPQFIDGAHVRPGAFAGEETVAFLSPVGRKPVVYAGIIDPVTIPASLPGLREVTAKGAFHQAEANRFLKMMVEWGMTSYDVLEHTGASPFENLMADLRDPARRVRYAIAREDAPMAVRVEVDGAGAQKRLGFEVHDFGRRATTSAAARAALMLARGALGFAGVRAPEGCLDPAPFLRDLARLPGVAFHAWEDDGEPGPLAVSPAGRDSVTSP